MKKCPICGAKGSHILIGVKGSLVLEPLTKEDWKEIYFFTQQQERELLAFTHQLIEVARNRAVLEEKL